MNKKILPWIITFCALGLGGTAAYYSIIGLSKMFIGNATPVIVMATFLEISKLTIAALLHTYWDLLSKLFKMYYIISLIILSLLTSAGIYGILSEGYQKTSDKNEVIEFQYSTLENKIKLLEESKNDILIEKQSLITLQSNLSKSSQTQYTDKKGNLVLRSNNNVLKNIESNSKSNEKLSEKIDIINDSISSIKNKMLEIKSKVIGESELGPLKYISSLTNISMDKIINWYILVIIFVFDPLAISLVMAASFAFKKSKEEKINNIEEFITPNKENSILLSKKNDSKNIDDIIKQKEYEYSQFKNHVSDFPKKQNLEKDIQYLRSLKKDNDKTY